MSRSSTTIGRNGATRLNRRPKAPSFSTTTCPPIVSDTSVAATKLRTISLSVTGAASSFTTTPRDIT